MNAARSTPQLKDLNEAVQVPELSQLIDSSVSQTIIVCKDDFVKTNTAAKLQKIMVFEKYYWAHSFNQP